MKQLLCTRTSAYGGDHCKIDWGSLPISPRFVHSFESGGPAYETRVQAAWDAEFLYLHFYCQDDEVLAGMTERDDPIYDEEVVEAFLAPHSLRKYYEFNLSPRNVVFDSLIKHDGRVHRGNPEWDCPGLKHGVTRHNPQGRSFGDWDGYLAVPFTCLDLVPASGLVIRANFYRIKRLGGEQFLAWSPTGSNPANFHVPDKFGELIFV